MNKRLWKAVTAGISVACFTTFLHGCTPELLDLNAEIDDSPQGLAEVWGIEVPASMVTEKSYDSGPSFQGDGDYILVMKLPKEDQTGQWSPDAFQLPFNKTGPRRSLRIQGQISRLKI